MNFMLCMVIIGECSCDLGMINALRTCVTGESPSAVYSSDGH